MSWGGAGAGLGCNTDDKSAALCQDAQCELLQLWELGITKSTRQYGDVADEAVSDTMV